MAGGRLREPLSLYYRTKYAADLALQAMGGVGIARLRMPLDHRPDPRNLLTKLAGYTHVIDVANSVTVVDDLIVAAAALIERRAPGIFHVTNPGLLHHRHLMELYRRYVDPDHRCVYIEEGELLDRGLVARTRSNCRLASSRLEALGINLRPIDSVVEALVGAYGR